MKPKEEIAIEKFDFNGSAIDKLLRPGSFRDMWPLVYILLNEHNKEAYIGETTDARSRLNTHLKSSNKKNLKSSHIIISEKFNKSATLDIESNLIKYFSGDGEFKLLNGNIGLADHNYYQKRELYWEMFQTIWNKLRQQGVARHSLDYINNSDLFKYSPYKVLSSDQKNSLALILRGILDLDIKTTIVNGGAGTGKTILATFLFKLLHSEDGEFNFKDLGEDELEFIDLVKKLKVKYPNLKMGLVVPMSSFRSTLKKVFKNIKGLSSNMVIAPAEVVKQQFDILVVDEAHRLRRRINLGTYFGAFDNVCEKLKLNKHTATELDWILLQSKNAICFYDEKQSIKPSDVKKETFKKLERNPSTRIENLHSQFRVRGGQDYISYIDKLFECKLSNEKVFNSTKYEFFLFHSLAEMVRVIKGRNKEYGLSRIVAGYAWDWVSQKNAQLFDIEIDGIKLRWNSVKNDWVNSENAIDEAGCIHTTQGYDLNYTGIIVGSEVSYDEEKNELLIRKENYRDKNGKLSIADLQELKNFIVNIYKTICFRGIHGTYIFVQDDKLRNYLAKHILAYPIQSKIPEKTSKLIPFVNSVPLINLKATAGDFSHPHTFSENAEWVALPPGLQVSKDLFAIKVVGDSMNKVIPNGSICLFNKYNGGTRDGRIVLAQHTSLQEAEFGSGFTVKEYHSTKKSVAEGWQHEHIELRPLSYDPTYSSILLKETELEQVRVIGIFEQVLY